MDSLYMLRLPVDGSRLARLAERRRLPRRAHDSGYAVHCLLAELFGDLAPKPFVIERAEGRCLPVLAYSSIGMNELTDAARQFAEPDVWQTLRWEGAAGKQMPAEWRTGSQCAFRLRMCPVERKNSAGENHRAGAEVDAFLGHVWRERNESPPSRDAVYEQWLRRQFQAGGVAEIAQCRMESFQLTDLARKDTGGRRLVRKPDAVISGKLTITDGQGFNAWLARGIGRHRAFGFGMLLLRAVGGD